MNIFLSFVLGVQKGDGSFEYSQTITNKKLILIAHSYLVSKGMNQTLYTFRGLLFFEHNNLLL